MTAITSAAERYSAAHHTMTGQLVLFERSRKHLVSTILSASFTNDADSLSTSNDALRDVKSALPRQVLWGYLIDIWLGVMTRLLLDAMSTKETINLAWLRIQSGKIISEIETDQDDITKYTFTTGNLFKQTIACLTIFARHCPFLDDPSSSRASRPRAKFNTTEVLMYLPRCLCSSDTRDKLLLLAGCVATDESSTVIAGWLMKTQEQVIQSDDVDVPASREKTATPEKENKTVQSRCTSPVSLKRVRQHLQEEEEEEKSDEDKSTSPVPRIDVVAVRSRIRATPARMRQERQKDNESTEDETDYGSSDYEEPIPIIKRRRIILEDDSSDDSSDDDDDDDDDDPPDSKREITAGQRATLLPAADVFASYTLEQHCTYIATGLAHFDDEAAVKRIKTAIVQQSTTLYALAKRFC